MRVRGRVRAPRRGHRWSVLEQLCQGCGPRSCQVPAGLKGQIRTGRSGPARCTVGASGSKCPGDTASQPAPAFWAGGTREAGPSALGWHGPRGCGRLWCGPSESSSPQAHPGPCPAAVDVEQVPKERPRHQEGPRRQPAAALQGALRVPDGGERAATALAARRSPQGLGGSPGACVQGGEGRWAVRVIRSRSRNWSPTAGWASGVTHPLPPGEQHDRVRGEEGSGRPCHRGR